MKFKRMISFVLSLGIIISTLTGITAVSAAEVDGFTNLVSNGDFNGELDESLWTVSANSATGSSVKIVTDTKDSSNKVLRFDGSTNKGTSAWINCNAATSGKKYYVSLKVRVAEKDGYTPQENMYFYADSLSTIKEAYYSSTRPKITQNDWTVCSGVFTATKQNIGFTIKDKVSSGSNIKDAIYEIDDFVLYELTGSKTITLPTGVSIVSGVITSIGKSYAMPGSTVVLKYEDTTQILTSEQAAITKNDIKYTFTMPNEDVTVALADAPKFTNLIANGNMEDTELAHKWKNGSNAKGAEITIEEDSAVSGNHVLKFNGTGIYDSNHPNTPNSNPMSYMSYADKLEEGRYYYSYKIRQAEEDTNTGSLYAYNSQHSAGSGNLKRPQLAKTWSTRSGIYDISSASNFNFKIISNQGEKDSNVPNVIYELDNVVVYDFNNIYEFVLPENATLVEGGKRLDITTVDENWKLWQTPKYFAVVGEKIKFEYTGREELVIDGVELTSDGNTYTFTMPGKDTTVDLVELPAFTNLVENGDMQDPDTIKWNGLDDVTGEKITIEPETEEPTNYVLRFDGTGIKNDSARKLSYVSYSNLLEKGKTYYYSYRIRLVEGDESVKNFYANTSDQTGANNLCRPEIVKERWITRSSTFTATGTSFSFKIISDWTKSGSDVSNVVYQIDDFVIYDFTDIYKITLPANATLMQGGRVLEVTDSKLNQAIVCFAKKGEEVKVQYAGKDLLNVTGAEPVREDDTYTFTMPDGDVTFAKDITINDKTAQNANITVAKSGSSFVVIAAKYNSEGMAEAYIADIVTEEANQVVTFKNIPEFSTISDWTGMKIFVWNNFEDL